MNEKALKELRGKIDVIDEKIVSALEERARVVREIGEVKKANGLSFYNPAREQAVLNRVFERHQGEFPKASLVAIFREIMGASLSLEKPMTVAFLGPETTFTNIAAIKHFGHAVEYRPARTISDVFVEVEKGLADHGVVPIENTTEGAVVHTLDLLVHSPLKIVSEVVMEISNYLLSESPLSEIKEVYSHPQPLGQCRNWLEANLSSARIIETSSTARAAEMVKGKPGQAAIASKLAAERFGVPIAAEKIQDFAGNVTRFLVLGTEEVPATGKDKTAIAFSMKDRVGALLNMLKPFDRHGINLTKLESRPARREGWKYIFFADFEGHHDEPHVAEALEELTEHCVFMKILGSYPIIDAEPIKD